MAKTLGVNYRNIEADLLAPPRSVARSEADGSRRRLLAGAGVRRGRAAEAISAAVRKGQHEMMGFATSETERAKEANSHFLLNGKKVCGERLEKRESSS